MVPGIALDGLERQPAREVVGGSEIDHRAADQRDRAEERRIAGQRLVADGEGPLLGRRIVVGRDGLREVELQRRLPHRTRVEAEERPKQVEHVGIGRRDVGGLSLRGG
jgi:hypothetical protein